MFKQLFPAFRRRGVRLSAAALLFTAPSFLADAAIRPEVSDTVIPGRITSGVVGSLTLRAMLLQDHLRIENGALTFSCECLKLSVRVQTARGVHIENKTFCE